VSDVQACIWLHLRLLLPLLPTVRADREVNSRRNLRHSLSSVLPQLLLSPYVRAQPAGAGGGDGALSAAAVAGVAGAGTVAAGVSNGVGCVRRSAMRVSRWICLAKKHQPSATTWFCYGIHVADQQ
jgi:hypothetical protein